MDVVCLSCIVIILCMSYIFMRKRKPNYSIAILPLILVPIIHLFSSFIYKLLGNVNMDYNLFVLALDVIALVVECILFGFLSNNIETKKTKVTYCIMCGGFSALFTFALLKDLFIN